jgi:hypothetical protein
MGESPRGVAPSGLESTAAFKDNATHRVTISAPENMDGPLRRWLEAAYDARR